MSEVMRLTPPEIELDYTGEVIVFDLDDTLYPEREYMVSGFRAVAEEVFVSNTEGESESATAHVSVCSPEELVRLMTEAYDRGDNAMDALAHHLSVSSDEREKAIRRWVQTYRQHVPLLTLPTSSRETLQALKAKGVRMALVTDGRSKAQRAKIKSLSLDSFFPEDCIYISEEHAAGKDTIAPFEYIAHIFPNASRFYYVADNPAKDFLFPNLMGWQTICLLDKGKNIHPQHFDLAKEYLPTLSISSLRELLTLNN